MKVFCAAFLLVCLAACAAPHSPGKAEPSAFSSQLPAIDEAAPLAFLQDGGYVLVMRHGASPHDQANSITRSEGCILGEGRGLTEEGATDAASLGAFLIENAVPILKAYTSDMCRSWDTAALVAGNAPVIPHPSQKTTDPVAVAAFKAEIEGELSANPGMNILLVNHSNIAPLYGAIERPDEDELPEGVVSVVSPGDWHGLDDGVIMRIDAGRVMVMKIKAAS